MVDGVNETLLKLIPLDREDCMSCKLTNCAVLFGISVYSLCCIPLRRAKCTGKPKIVSSVQCLLAAYSKYYSL